MFVPYAPSNIDRVIRGAQAIGGLANAGLGIGRALYGRFAGSRGGRRKQYVRGGGARRGRFNGRRTGFSKTPAVLTSGRQEIKTLDILFSQFLNDVAQITQVNGTITGSGFSQRVGRKINMLSLQMDGWIYASEAAGAVANKMLLNRFALVYDRQSNGTTPAWSDVFQDVDYNDASSNEVLSHVNMNNRDRFVIIRDWHHKTPPIGAVATNPVSDEGEAKQDNVVDGRLSSNFHEFINLRGLQTVYKASSSPPVLADVATGGLFFISRGQDLTGTLGNSSWVVLLQCRLRFAD